MHTSFLQPLNTLFYFILFTLFFWFFILPSLKYFFLHIHLSFIQNDHISTFNILSWKQWWENTLEPDRYSLRHLPPPLPLLTFLQLVFLRTRIAVSWCILPDLPSYEYMRKSASLTRIWPWNMERYNRNTYWRKKTRYKQPRD